MFYKGLDRMLVEVPPYYLRKDHAVGAIRVQASGS